MRINARGQVTIPAEIRKRAGLLPHTEVIVEFDGEDVRIVRNDAIGGRLLAQLRGRGDIALSTEAIMALTRAE
jgi:AbrB family looped-hinge helix DNA binding protein